MESEPYGRFWSSHPPGDDWLTLSKELELLALSSAQAGWTIVLLYCTTNIVFCWCSSPINWSERQSTVGKYYGGSLQQRFNFPLYQLQLSISGIQCASCNLYHFCRYAQLPTNHVFSLKHCPTKVNNRNLTSEANNRKWFHILPASLQ